MTKTLRRQYLLPALLCALCASTQVLAQDSTLDRAKQLVATKQARAAFDLLEPLEQQRAGEPDFDYTFGVAATDAGELTRAVFALERVLAVQPNHPQARAEIARAYFLMGENRVAREEFEAVKASSPPAGVVASIDRFLSAIDSRTASNRSGFTAYLEAGIGNDSNANSATGSSSFAIPAFGGLVFTLAPGAGQRSDTFTTLAGGISARKALPGGWSLVGNVNVSQRFNSTLDQFNTGTYGADGGVAYRRDADEYSAIVQANAFDVDYTRFREAFGGVLQWRRSLSQSQQVAVYGQLTRLTYPGAVIRNADRQVLGVAWANALAMRFDPVIYVGAYGGEEQVRSRVDTPGDPAYNPQFGHRMFGARVGGQVTFSPQWSAFTNFSYEERRYGGPDPLFLMNRNDKEWNLRVGANYVFARNWTITPAMAFTDNQSNIVINAYRRNLFSATLRYDFR